ncbi:MAG: alpha/beta hydrolase [Actinobacteria bacterium]|nr:alpha/beta hydrolase [Actinomycetota bacterium]
MKNISLITEHIASTDLVELSVYKYGRFNDFADENQSSQQDLKPAVMLSHATGFHGRCFDPVVETLQSDYACTSFDYRGYGDSLLIKDWAVDWQSYCDDALAVARSLKNNNQIIAVGHSMGAAALAMAALSEPELFKALILYEPIIFPASMREASTTPHQPSPLVEGARRRRTTFASRDEAFANYSSKPPMNVFNEKSLRAYVDYGFRDSQIAETNENCVVLKCHPEHEARTYETGASHETWERLHLLQVPTWIVAGAVAPNQPSAWSELIAKEIRNSKFIQWSDVGHFGPMQQPHRLADLVREVDALTS